MNTAKEVNPDLYKMRSRHLLSYDGQAWVIYDSNRKGQGLGMRGQNWLGGVRGQGSGVDGLGTGWRVQSSGQEG